MPKTKVTEASVNITDIASQREPSSLTTRSVSAALSPDWPGLSRLPKTSAITPMTRALADRGIHSDRMSAQ